MNRMRCVCAILCLCVAYCTTQVASPGSGSETTGMCGYVVFEDGTPAPGAKLELRSAMELAGINEPYEALRATADDSGAFRFSPATPDTFLVAARYGDSLSAMIRAAGGANSQTANVRLTLRPNSAVIGRILAMQDTSSVPLSIRVFGLGRTVKTNSLGEFNIESLPAGLHRFAFVRDDRSTVVARSIVVDLAPDTTEDIGGIPVLSYWFTGTDAIRYNQLGLGRPVWNGDTLQIHEQGFPVSMTMRIRASATASIVATLNGRQFPIRENAVTPPSLLMWEMGCAMTGACVVNGKPVTIDITQYPSRVIEIGLTRDDLAGIDLSLLRVSCSDTGNLSFVYQWSIAARYDFPLPPSYGYYLIEAEYVARDNIPIINHEGYLHRFRVVNAVAVDRQKLPLLFTTPGTTAYMPLPDTVTVFCYGLENPPQTAYLALLPDGKYGTVAQSVSSALLDRMPWFNKADLSGFYPTDVSSMAGYDGLRAAGDGLLYNRARGCPWACMCIDQAYLIDSSSRVREIGPNWQTSVEPLFYYQQIADSGQICGVSVPAGFDKFTVEISRLGTLRFSTIATGFVLEYALSPAALDSLQGIFTAHNWNAPSDPDTVHLDNISSVAHLVYDGRGYVITDKVHPSDGLQAVFDEVTAWCEAHLRPRFEASYPYLLDTLYGSPRAITIGPQALEFRVAPCLGVDGVGRDFLRLKVSSNADVVVPLSLDHFWILQPDSYGRWIRAEGELKESMIIGSEISAICDSLISPSDTSLSHALLQIQGSLVCIVCRIRDAQGQAYYLKWDYDREFGANLCD